MTGNNQKIELFFDEMFIGLASTLLENPEDVFHKKMLLREYFKRYQKIEDRNAFNTEVESARLTNQEV